MMAHTLIRWRDRFAFASLCLFLAVLYLTSPFGDLQPTTVNIVRRNSSLGNLLMLRMGVADSRLRDQQRVAICLVGGARAFELTGPSIKKYLLDVYKDADLFVNAPVDGNANKFTLLSGVHHPASFRLFVPDILNETTVHEEVLTRNGSPNGIQGLLQYFRLVEGCLDMIEDYETRHGFKYDWVIRTRVDGYWSAPMPPLHAFEASKYYVPYGSGFGGLNDRLGVGSRATSAVALSRLSLLPSIHKLGYRGLNSESSFKAQFSLFNMEVGFSGFPFCVLSMRKYRWTSGRQSVPVLSIQSRGPLNGAKCRPCTPKLVGALAWKAINASERSRGWIGPTEDPQLCDAQDGWEDGWEQIYDKVSGHEMAQVRKSIHMRSVIECIQDLEHFEQQWEIWSAPSAEELCSRRLFD